VTKKKPRAFIDFIVQADVLTDGPSNGDRCNITAAGREERKVWEVLGFR
jgi:hypothetical protein